MVKEKDIITARTSRPQIEPDLQMELGHASQEWRSQSKWRQLQRSFSDANGHCHVWWEWFWHQELLRIFKYRKRLGYWHGRPFKMPGSLGSQLKRIHITGFQQQCLKLLNLLSPTISTYMLNRFSVIRVADNRLYSNQHYIHFIFRFYFWLTK